MSSATAVSLPRIRIDRLEWLGFSLLLGSVSAVLFSIAVAQALLALTALAWAVLIALRGESPVVPAPFRPLAPYAALTVASALACPDPLAALADAKELVLFIVVALVLRLARGPRASTLVWTILTFGAISALVGIVQYGVLQFDNLGRRPQGTLTHYMTYSGELMLVAVAAAARALFHRGDRAWPSLIMPALLVALTLTFTRSAWVGVSAALGILFLLKDLRLFGALPVIAAAFIALAPSSLTDRVYSMFDLNDPTNRERVEMLRFGGSMVRTHPLLGVGPDRVQQVYIEYLDREGTHTVNPHLHNVPLQIAAERGLPALAVWLWFIVGLGWDLVRRVREGRHTALAAGALGSLVAMLAAGLFEYNFGDSEFLILWLALVSAPYAADTPEER